MKPDTKWIKAAQRATTPTSRRRFTRRHRASKLRAKITACEACPLAATRLNTVPFDNDLPHPLAFVGEAPGAAEDKTGTPFVGRSGRLLDTMIEATGHIRTDVTVLNTVACRPPRNRKPTVEESAACRPLFDRQLDFTGAWVVVLLGASALNQIRPNSSITNLQGKPFWMTGRIFIPTFHPAYVLRKPNLQSTVQRDIGLAFNIVEGKEWWEPISVKHMSSRDDKLGSDLTNLIDVQGWAAVDSANLEDRIVVVADDNVKVPAKYVNHVRYTVEEMVRIGELGRGQKLTSGELASIHLVKRLGGTILK